MLYQSLYVPEGQTPFARDIVEHPRIAVYVKDWGREDDAGFVAVDKDGQSLGVVWMRLLRGEERGYGFVDERTPEIGMAVLHAYRGRGIGTCLLTRLLGSAEGVYQSISLSVGAENPARRLYERQGFAVVGEQDGSLTMKRELAPQTSVDAS